MKKGKLFFWTLIVALVLVLAYVKYSKNKETQAKMIPMGKGGPQTLRASGFVIEYSKLSNTLSANGSVLAQDEVQLQPEVSGRVTYLNIKEGSIVSKGTLLLKINDADLKAQLAKLNTQIKIAQANLNRLAELIKINGVSQAEYDAAENTVNNIKADMQILQVQIDKTELRAPFTGKLGLRNISLGAMVSPSTIIASLQNISQLKMDISLPEKYASVIHIGDKLQCTIAGMDTPFSASIFAIEPQIDEMTRNLTVRAIIQTANAAIMPGAYVKVNLKLKEIPNTIMIPSSAIIPDDRYTKVVIADSSMAKFVKVEIGVRTENEVQILNGLKVGDTVLTSGLLQVKPGTIVQFSSTTSNSAIK
ncbi:MAG TPA: efflux RND transporter periplasmic adaptor subunit [Chitinophagales bacterium]|jgi:membrane fusion protein (multidrug efflux system)|nr:efflux RND transporter periplasmic adaptor subunit [Chitinophagales bacterium]MBP6154829.1 efflux RND transporter periplasmic adaptor subunit [Chitinophagales bacterium]HQV78558.1 efflux RND transporter periplasmic adaptor subunit [Chitinophagales bacterium]HQW79056.1 efflux RND transporter periplasmic adaptor subunit [Chitinophagales bacterium]HRB67561.1 efflux RND transporter periplasmic adaptor subunit [Chitinophagales bacterium]